MPGNGCWCEATERRYYTIKCAAFGFLQESCPVLGLYDDRFRDVSQSIPFFFRAGDGLVTCWHEVLLADSQVDGSNAKNLWFCYRAHLSGCWKVSIVLEIHRPKLQLLQPGESDWGLWIVLLVEVGLWELYNPISYHRRRLSILHCILPCNDYQLILWKSCTKQDNPSWGRYRPLWQRTSHVLTTFGLFFREKITWSSKHSKLSGVRDRMNEILGNLSYVSWVW